MVASVLIDKPLFPSLFASAKKVTKMALFVGAKVIFDHLNWWSKPRSRIALHALPITSAHFRAAPHISLIPPTPSQTHNHILPTIYFYKDFENKYL